ncbi:MAG: enoyl-CoA hydratase-related protein [Acidobacteriota bacterium]
MPVPSLKHVHIASLDGGLLTLTLDRPPVNALGRALVEDLDAALDHIEAADPASMARAVIVAARGKCFCAGADLKERQGMSEEDVRAWVPFLSGTFTRLASLPMPTVAVVHGVAVGGGLELVLACDLRIAEEPARLGLRETALAIIPGAGGTQRLPRLIGPARAKRWIFTAAMHSAAEALADGAVDQVVPAGKGLEAARELARAIAANGPVAVRLAKRAIDVGCDGPLAAGLDEERRCYEGVLPTEDRLEALKAFLEKRPPTFKGH